MEYNLDNNTIKKLKHIRNIIKSNLVITSDNYCKMSYSFYDYIEDSGTRDYTINTSKCKVSTNDTSEDCYRCYSEVLPKINLKNDKFNQIKEEFEAINDYANIEYKETDYLVGTYFRNSDNKDEIETYLTGSSSFTKTPKTYYTYDNFELLKDLIWYDEEKGENVVCMPFREEGDKDEEFAFIRYKNKSNYTLSEIY